jgi:hypothetical protein
MNECFTVRMARAPEDADRRRAGSGRGEPAAAKAAVTTPCDGGVGMSYRSSATRAAVVTFRRTASARSGVIPSKWGSRLAITSKAR